MFCLNDFLFLLCWLLLVVDLFMLFNIVSIILNPLNVDSIISEHGVLDETAEDICLICFEDLKICQCMKM